MAEISSTIEIKKRKLSEELSKKNPRAEIVKRLEDSIYRHKKEMKSINKGKLGRKRRECFDRRRMMRGII